jgi:hypothetical protein
MKKQYEAVIEVMKENGGYSTLGYLYQKVPKVPGVEWKTKTPFASIRRIVQDPRFFFKIRPGLWALKEFRQKLPAEILSQKKASNSRDSFDHSYYQGLLVEIGNLKKLKTFIPPQDKNRRFLGKTLGEIVSLHAIPSFAYPNLTKKAESIDVIWFNVREMPDSFFEVEHSTNIQNSLLKFVELQDFHSNFFIVADKVRQAEFLSKISMSAFKPVSTRTKFVDYDKVSLWHSRTAELSAIENSLTQ